MSSSEEAIYQVLVNIDQEDGNFTLPALIDWLSKDRPGNVFSRAELELAAEHCLAMGWVKILSEQDCEQDRLRWLDDPHQFWIEGLYRPGCIDFTSIGWNAYSKMSEAVNRRRIEDWLNEYPSIQYLWRIPGRVSMLSTSKEILQRELAAVQGGEDEIVSEGIGKNHTLGEIIGPYPTGPWWVKRFYRAPSGFRADVSFEPGDMNI